ncbi:MAG: hypothetical protein JWN14_2111 [Chthonomonadales bacterium]|nr:hypothetical protein [Chthonomonadales bacterium]
MQEETIALEDIDYFVFWTRERLSETERDTRCVTQRGREVVLHFTQDEQLACLLGYLCKKPAWKRDADGTLTRLSLPESLQSLLRPSADEAVQEAQDLLRASSGQSKPTAPSELLRPAETSLEATPPVTSNAVSYPEL